MNISDNCDRRDWPARLRRRAASEYLSERHGIATAPATLAKLAVTGGGPEYELWGRIPYYPTDKLDQWVHARLLARRSTSDSSFAMEKQVRPDVRSPARRGHAKPAPLPGSSCGPARDHIPVKCAPLPIATL